MIEKFHAHVFFSFLCKLKEGIVCILLQENRLTQFCKCNAQLIYVQYIALYTFTDIFDRFFAVIQIYCSNLKKLISDHFEISFCQ